MGAKRPGFVRFRVGGQKKKSSENDQLTGHFQCLFVCFCFFLISPEKNSKTSEVNQQSVLNLYIFPHFSRNLDRTITFNSVTLKNTQTEPQKYNIFFFFDKTNNI